MSRAVKIVGNYATWCSACRGNAHPADAFRHSRGSGLLVSRGGCGRRWRKGGAVFIDYDGLDFPEGWESMAHGQPQHTRPMRCWGVNLLSGKECRS